MIANRLARIASILSAALLGVMLIGVSGATAATPGWTMHVTLIPTSVSPGAYAAYRVDIANVGKSNISQLYFTDSRTETPFSITPSTGCTPSAALFCSIGPLNSGASKSLIVVYQTPSSGSAFPVTFQLNTSGSTFSDQKGRSHGDTLSVPVSTTLDGTADFAGGYVVAGGTTFSTATGNIQQTTVDSPDTNIPVTIQESSGGSTSQCGSGTPIGQLSTINVNNGHQYATAFQTTLKIQTSALPDELLLGQVQFCHLYDGAASGTLLPACASDAAPANNVPCFFAKWNGTSSAHDKDHNGDADDADNHLFLVIDVWDLSNGSVRGQFF